MNIMDRKELIEKYMEAETTGAEESMLAESFASEPPRDEEERKVEAILKAFRPALPDGEEEYDRMVREARRRAVLGWVAGGLSWAGSQACQGLRPQRRPSSS